MEKEKTHTLIVGLLVVIIIFQFLLISKISGQNDDYDFYECYSNAYDGTTAAINDSDIESSVYDGAHDGSYDGATDAVEDADIYSNCYNGGYDGANDACSY